MPLLRPDLRVRRLSPAQGRPGRFPLGRGPRGCGPTPGRPSAPGGADLRPRSWAAGPWGKPMPCRARRDKPLCPHGRPTWCTTRHRPGDPGIGKPLCLDCYDHDAHVVWNHHAAELWRRASIALRRAVARLGKAYRVKLRISFGKVAESQARGVVHFNALIRLDAVLDTDDGPKLVPPPACIHLDHLADVLRHACASTTFG